MSGLFGPEERLAIKRCSIGFVLMTCGIASEIITLFDYIENDVLISGLELKKNELVLILGRTSVIAGGLIFFERYHTIVRNYFEEDLEDY